MDTITLREHLEETRLAIALELTDATGQIWDVHQERLIDRIRAGEASEGLAKEIEDYIEGRTDTVIGLAIGLADWVKVPAP